jgi:hypothetical protein
MLNGETNMPTQNGPTNRVILENIQSDVQEVRKEMKSLTKLMYGKNGDAEAIGLLEIVHANSKWICEQKERKKWVVRGLLGLFAANIMAMISGIMYFIHVGSKLVK